MDVWKNALESKQHNKESSKYIFFYCFCLKQRWTPLEGYTVPQTCKDEFLQGLLEIYMHDWASLHLSPPCSAC